jgi:hypothetical protein
LLLALAGLAFASLYEAGTHVVRGWFAGEAFYDGRPASYWAAEIQRWEKGASFGGAFQQHQIYQRRSALHRELDRFLPGARSEWPQLFDGDPGGLAVLQELRQHPSEEVRDWARVGMERIDYDQERGPVKTVSALLDMRGE